MIERIEILLGRQAMINPGNSLVTDVAETLGAQNIVHLTKQHHGLRYRQFFAHQQSSVSQSAMRAKRVTAGMCRQHSQQTTIRIKHQRVVTEAVTVVIHIATIEEEGSVLRLCHELIPFVSLVWCISYYFEHPTYFRNSS